MSLRFRANPSFREGLLFISDMIYNVVMNKKDNKTKRIAKGAKQAIPAKNEMIVLLEAMRDDIKIVAEGNSALNQKIDNVHQSLNQKIDDNHNDTKSSFQTIFRYLSDIDNELKSIKSEITELKVALNEKADKEKLLELERRVISLEKELATLR